MLNAQSFGRALKEAGKRVWRNLPAGLQERPPVRSVNRWIHALSRKFSPRSQSHMTRFLRYPPTLLTIRDLIDACPSGGHVRLCVIGCSTGAEVYSILWAVRSARSDLQIRPIGIDLSEAVIEKAKAGRYAAKDPELNGLPEESWSELFDITQSELTIKDSIAAGAQWIVGDVHDDGLRVQLGPQDIVVANNFLIHMREEEATACLRKVVRFIAPGGLLFCRGVDLDVRERIARQFSLEPISLRIEEIHNVGLRERGSWPWEYWGLEPLDKTREDWARRYATIFRVPCTPTHLPNPSVKE